MVRISFFWKVEWITHCMYTPHLFSIPHGQSFPLICVSFRALEECPPGSLSSALCFSSSSPPITLEVCNGTVRYLENSWTGAWPDANSGYYKKQLRSTFLPCFDLPCKKTNSSLKNQLKIWILKGSTERQGMKLTSKHPESQSLF